jgi:hypothetical protein
MLSLLLFKNAQNRIQEYNKEIITSYSNSDHKAFIHLMSLNHSLSISSIFLTAMVQLFWLGLTLYLLARALRAQAIYYRLLKFVFCY